MRWSRRQLLLATGALTTGALVALGTCRAGGDPTGPSSGGSGASTSQPSSPHSTPASTAVPLLTDPGQARAVVNQLRQAAGHHPVIKVDITATTASVSVLVEQKPQTWSWISGEIKQVTSDIEYIGQGSFDPDSFRFDDLQLIFGLAGALSGSTSNQELQIVEYNPGQVLMVVSTRPESRPVFFRPDATPIHVLDFSSAKGLDEGLRDALGGRTQLLQLGLVKSTGIWVDAPSPTESGVVVRRTRNAKLPTWTATKKQSSDWPLFAASDVTATKLASIMADLPTRYNKAIDVEIGFQIDMRDRKALPLIRWNVGGQEVITDLEGVDITKQING